MNSVSIEQLRTVIAFHDLPDDHLQWILDRTEYQEYGDGELIVKHGEPAEIMWILLEGKVSFYMDVNGRKVFYFVFDNDAVTGGVSGLLPYSRMKTSPGDAYALGQTKILKLHKQHFPELEILNPSLIQRMIGYMTERARTFATMQLQHEKVNALGNLAAGIAHELNNPASAITRISNELIRRLSRNYELTEQLLKSRLSSDHVHNIRTIVENIGARSTASGKASLRARMENEEMISEWFESLNISHHEAVETFSENHFSKDDLESIRNEVGREAFMSILPWLENLLSSQRIIKDLEEASGRISTLVGAIKSHVHMDRTNELQLTNIHKDIENTVTLLGFKIRGKNISVTRNFCDDMPDVAVYVGELNQVWTNIIDNAVFAMPQNGTLIITTECDDRSITVRIVDNGPGIPKEIVSRIFDPFFTTKKVGEGTGIGLDIVQRIVKRHNGEIKVFSEPGKTEFSISLPIEQPSDSLK